jgi:hypothetical protein
VPCSAPGLDRLYRKRLLFLLPLFGCIYTHATNLEANHAYQLLTVSKKNTGKRSERKIKVDKNEVKVKTPPPSIVRPEYSCMDCNMSFPSELDLIEHKKIDHNKKGNITE